MSAPTASTPPTGVPPTATARAPDGSVRTDYFERLYQAAPDPWGFATSPYEAAKYAATIGALPRARYRAGFEVGCAIGVLTAALAERCDRLLAVDVASEALAAARRRTAAHGGVRVARMAVPEAWPDGRFDLVVISEVGYYLADAALARLAARTAVSTERGGHLVLVHYTGETDYPQSADAVHAAFLGDARAWRRLRSAPGAAYRLDVLERL